VGGVRDFNRVEIKGVSPDAIEQGLSGFEGEVASALRKVRGDKNLDDEMTYALIMNLMALIAVRNPQNRTQWTNFQSDVMKKMLALMVGTEERWKSVTNQMRETGVESVHNVTFEQMRDFIDRDAYDISVNREHHIAIEMEGIDVVLPCLFERSWTFLVASKDAGPFVTSDKPVILTWRHPEEIPPFYRNSPGFGMADTRVVFPVSKEIAIVGEFDTEDQVAFVGKRTVATINSQICFFANSQIYSPSLRFNWISPDGKIKVGPELLSFTKEKGI